MRRLRDVRIGGRSVWYPLIFLALFVVFVALRALAGRTGIPVHFLYPIQFEHAILGGRDATAWLQARLFSGAIITPLHLLLITVYGSYFVVPPVMALVLWWRRSARRDRYTVALYGTLFLGLVVVFLVPTAPPWLASERGYLPPITRLTPLIVNHIYSGLFSTGESAAGENVVAAMPSLHMATICVVAWYLPWRRWAGALLSACYPALMALTLIYFGEHYLTDILAGLLLAAVVVTLVELGARGRERPGSRTCPEDPA